jgi:hypothetical protein
MGFKRHFLLFLILCNSHLKSSQICTKLRVCALKISYKSPCAMRVSDALSSRIATCSVNVKFSKESSIFCDNYGISGKCVTHSRVRPCVRPSVILLFAVNNFLTMRLRAIRMKLCTSMYHHWTMKRIHVPSSKVTHHISVYGPYFSNHERYSNETLHRYVSPLDGVS